MKFKTELTQAKFIKRYKRFFADCELQGQTVTAHVANTGSLKPNLQEGINCLLSKADNPDRKLQWSLEAVQAPNQSWVGINTAIPSKVVQEIFETGAYKPWNEFSKFKSEIKINDQTRLDGVFLDKNNHPKHYIEIKNVTYVVGDFATGKGQASFPDGVTERGLKHLHELSALIKKGFSAELIFAVQRTDCQQFVPADDIDPEYCRQLRKSAQDGLIITPMVFALDPSGVRFTGETLPVSL